MLVATLSYGYFGQFTVSLSPTNMHEALGYIKSFALSWPHPGHMWNSTAILFPGQFSPVNALLSCSVAPFFFF